MKWFGESWHAPVCRPEAFAPTPIGETCCRCWKPIRFGERGLLVPHLEPTGFVERPWHLPCWLDELGLRRESIEARREVLS